MKLPLEGFGPSIPYGHRILSAARIPVPTQGQAFVILPKLTSQALTKQAMVGAHAV